MAAAGAPHASEISYVFDTLHAQGGDAVTEQDQGVARMLNNYWANFAKTGDPNGADLPRWESFGKQPGQLLDFSGAGPVFGPIPDIKVIDFIAGLNH